MAGKKTCVQGLSENLTQTTVKPVDKGLGHKKFEVRKLCRDAEDICPYTSTLQHPCRDTATIRPWTACACGHRSDCGCKHYCMLMEEEQDDPLEDDVDLPLWAGGWTACPQIRLTSETTGRQRRPWGPYVQGT